MITGRRALYLWREKILIKHRTAGCTQQVAQQDLFETLDIAQGKGRELHI
jgi:hypothetical protein